jgi:hypothetical protein
LSAFFVILSIYAMLHLVTACCLPNHSDNSCEPLIER